MRKLRRKTGKKVQFRHDPAPEELLQTLNEVPLFSELEAVLEKIQEIFGQAADLVTRRLKVNSGQLALVYLDGMVNKTSVEKVLNEILLIRPQAEDAGLRLGTDLVRWLERGLAVGNVKVEESFGGVIRGILNGETALLADGEGEALLLETEEFEKRAVSEPQVEALVRGPREGFVENIGTNLTMIRRRLRHPSLRVEKLVLGDLTNTKVAVLYLEGVALEAVVEEVRRRIRQIKIDGVLESNYLEELIEDSPFSIFPQIGTTERPDRAVASLLEGRVLILTDGTPFVLYVPMIFTSLIHSPEDYYHRWHLVLGIRLLRTLGFFITLFLPSVYIALTTFHQELIPTPLAISLAMQREQVSYPAAVEAFLMQLIFEILVEAGLRLPRPLGQAISIVGALVIGEAAVQAGLVSAAMVIVISTTAIAAFLFPSYELSLSVRLLRFPMMLLSSVLGLFGIFYGLMLLLTHLVQLRSFGLPFMTPMAPFFARDQHDELFRAPWWAMRKRPKIIGSSDPMRQTSSISRKHLELEAEVEERKKEK